MLHNPHAGVWPLTKTFKKAGVGILCSCLPLEITMTMRESKDLILLDGRTSAFYPTCWFFYPYAARAAWPTAAVDLSTLKRDTAAQSLFFNKQVAETWRTLIVAGSTIVSLELLNFLWSVAWHVLTNKILLLAVWAPQHWNNLWWYKIFDMM